MRSRSVTTRFAYVDGLRAVAVLLVVWFHVIVGAALAHGRALEPIGDIGARGVDLFFVLSGFCLARPLLSAAAMNNGTLVIDYGTFLSRRFARIAPPYYIALVLFTILAATPFGYPSTWASSISALDGAGPREFFADLAFLTTRQPVANGTFWTLGIEMRWYFVCPYLVALFVRSRRAFYAAMIIAYAAYYLPPVQVLDLGTLPAFMFGIIAASISVEERVLDIRWKAIACASLALALTRQTFDPNVDHGDPIWHLAFFFVLVFARARMANRFLATAPLVFIGTASYAIYLIHLPFLDWFGRNGMPWPVAGSVATGLGVAFWAFVERPLVAPGSREAIAATVRRCFRRYARPSIVVHTPLFQRLDDPNAITSSSPLGSDTRISGSQSSSAVP